MTLGRRMTLVGSVACGCVLLVAAAVGAATIRGTTGNDTLRGGAKADKLYGLGGNDRLYGAGGNDLLVGGAGNDLLVGGPGADKLSCGPGRDTARGDANDKVAKDCEVVRGVPAPVPPTPPTPPPTPPPPPAPKAQPGIYCGNTVQGPPLCITTNADASGLVKIETASILDCTVPGQSQTFKLDSFTIGFEGFIEIRQDLTFELTYSGPLTTGSSEITNMQTSYFLRGTFTTDGKASGQLAVTTLTFDYVGYHFSCTQNPVDWSATRQG